MAEYLVSFLIAITKAFVVFAIAGLLWWLYGDVTWENVTYSAVFICLVDLYMLERKVSNK